MVIAIYVDWMVWWIQCCRPFLWPLIAFVPSIPQKRIKVLSRPFDASNLITTFKSVAFLDAVSQTIPRKHSMGVWVCASNYFIFLWQFFFFLNFLFFLLIQYVCYFFQKKKTNKCVDHGFVGRFFITGLLYQGTPHRFYKTSLLSLSYIVGPGKLLFPFSSEKQAFLSSTIKERF